MTESVDNKLSLVVSELTQLKDSTDSHNQNEVKRTCNYFDWTAKKTKIVSNEQDLIISHSFLPKALDGYAFGKLNEEEQNLIKRYYFVDQNGIYRQDSRKTIDRPSCIVLAKATQLRRGKVVWADFGFNVGEEFGGFHPALIIKRVSNGIIVLPLSSGKAKDNSLPYIVEVPNVYGSFFTKITRWTSIFRIRLLSLHRVDFNNNVGSVKPDVLALINTALKSTGLYFE